MPLYEYECGLCQHRFERKQRFDEEPVAICPLCHGKSHRVIHSSPVIFKGSGFYITDSRKAKAPDESVKKDVTKDVAKEKKEKKK